VLFHLSRKNQPTGVFPMKKLLTSSLFVLLVVNLGLAQRVVPAKEIFDQVDHKQAVAYENVTVEGDLDFTSLSNRELVKKENWETYLATVQVPMTFRNCTFRGKVLGYRTEPKLGVLNSILFNADFNDALTFENCTFDDDAAFKYSRVRQRATFAGCRFREVANFKYTQFRDVSDFSNCTFRTHADFKYTNFGESTAFQNSRFDGTADFKYTKFGERVSFRSARFDNMADFKYTHLPNGSDFDNAVFDGPTDFKYATLNGRRFSPER